jgi:DNA polymerase V
MPMELLYYETAVPAGFPSPALDYMEERIDLSRELISHPLSTFIVECTGDSMMGAFIPPKARLLVDRSLTPVNGSIVVAVLNGEFTVKFLRKNEHRCWLVPANSKYPEIKISGEMDMEVWGVVTYIITDTQDVRNCMR